MKISSSSSSWSSSSSPSWYYLILSPLCKAYPCLSGASIWQWSIPGGGDKVNLFSLMPCTCWGCEGAASNLLHTTGISSHPHWPPNSLFSHVLFLENLIKHSGNKFSDQWLDDNSIDLTVCYRLQF